MKRVLLVEPDIILANTIIEYLLRKNVAVQTAHDAQAAIVCADASRFDAVVLELAMPAHNGIEFLQEFRSYTDWKAIPIIIYSHIPREDTGLSVAEWHKYGVAGYLYKPTSSLARLSLALQNVEVLNHEAA